MRGKPLTTTIGRRPLDRLVLALLGLAGCHFNESYHDTQYRCDESGECPAGQVCQSGICRADPALAPGCGTLAAAVQDFDDLNLSRMDQRRWRAWSDAPDSMEVDDDRLELSLPANAQAVGAGFGTQPVYRLAGSAASVEVVSLSLDAGAELALALYARDDTRAILYFQDGMLYAAYQPPGSIMVLASLDFDPDEHRVWRVRELDGTVFWETSHDGAEFVEHASRVAADFGPWVGSYVSLWKQDISESSARVTLDNLNGTEAGASMCASESLTDDFADGTRDNAWQLRMSGACDIHETDGRLGFQFPAPGAHECTLESVALYDLRASTITVEAPLADIPGIEQCFKLLLPGGDDVEFELAHGKLRGETTLDEDKDVLFSIPFDPVAHRFWRFRGQDDELVWEASPDGVDWEVLGRHDGQDLDLRSVNIALIGDADDGPAENLGQSFDNLNLIP